MGLAFYYILRCQNTQPEVAHLNIGQEAPNHSLQLENARSFWKKSIEYKKSTKI